MRPYTFQLSLEWVHHAQAQEATSLQGWVVWSKAQHARGLASGAKWNEGNEWLENDGFSRHSYRQSNGRKEWRCVDGDPYTSIYTFFSTF